MSGSVKSVANARTVANKTRTAITVSDRRGLASLSEARPLGTLPIAGLGHPFLFVVPDFSLVRWNNTWKKVKMPCNEKLELGTLRWEWGILDLLSGHDS